MKKQAVQAENLAIGSVASSQQAAADSKGNNKDPPTAAEHQMTDTIVDQSTYKEPDAAPDNDTVGQNDRDTDAQQETLDIHKIKYGAILDASPDMDPTITTVRVANISSDTTKQDIMQLFELCTIAYLQENVRVTYFNRRGKHKAYALVRAPKFVCDNA